jgi:hypothetical protein
MSALSASLRPSTRGSARCATGSLTPGDVRNDPRIAEEMLEFMARHGVLSVAITDRIIGCPHQEGIDYQGPWCPVCEFWKGRDRFRMSACTEALSRGSSDTGSHA